MEKEFIELILAKLTGLEESSNKVLAKLEEHDKKFDQVFAKLEVHDKKFDQVFAKLEEHDKKLEEHEKLIKENSQEIRSIKEFIMIKEDELFNKIRALFDGYNSNFEKNINLEIRQNATEQKVEVNSFKISMLEDTSKRHEEQISKLSAK